MLLIGCSTNTPQSKQIHIAITGDKTIFDYDESFLNGIQMAVEDANNMYSRQGYTIKTSFYDDETIYEKGITLTNQFAKDPTITAVVGTQSFFILDTAAKLLSQTDKILIAPHGIAESTLEEGYSQVFCNTATATDFGKALAHYTLEAGIKRIAIFNSDTEYEKDIALAFSKGLRETDVVVLDYVTGEIDELGFEMIWERWEKLGIEAVLISQYFEQHAFELVSMIREKKQDMIILGDFSFDYQEMLEAYQPASEGIIIPQLVAIEDGKGIEEFTMCYEERFGSTPTWWAAHGYDTVGLIVNAAVEIGSTDPKRIAEVLHQERGYEGITGTFSFDEQGKMMGRGVNLLISKNGKFISLE